MTKQDILKENELSSRVLELIECQVAEAQGADGGMNTSDLQGAIQAIIMDAIRYGRGKA